MSVQKERTPLETAQDCVDYHQHRVDELRKMHTELKQWREQGAGFPSTLRQSMLEHCEGLLKRELEYHESEHALAVRQLGRMG